VTEKAARDGVLIIIRHRFTLANQKAVTVNSVAGSDKVSPANAGLWG
jgi:hypothetical protein